MNGLAMYDDDSSSSDKDSNERRPEASDSPGTSSAKRPIEKYSQPRASASVTRTENKFAGLVIRNPTKRPRLAEENVETDSERNVRADAETVVARPSGMDDNELGADTQSHAGQNEGAEELTRIRELLRPQNDWEIPPSPSDSEPDPALVAKLTQFAVLKSDPANPRHFNDSLMSNRSFRNPHLYAQLVDFVDVDESTTNFPKDVWDPWDVEEEWYAENLTKLQTETEKHRVTNQSKPRSRIDFTGSSSSASRGGSSRGGKASRFGTNTSSIFG